MNTDEIIKIKQWIACAKFIRKHYTFAYPRFFDETIKSDIIKQVKLESKLPIAYRSEYKVTTHEIEKIEACDEK